jgi:flagellar biosynthesis chaperone FliJ
LAEKEIMTNYINQLEDYKKNNIGGGGSVNNEIINNYKSYISNLENELKQYRDYYLQQQ